MKLNAGPVKARCFVIADASSGSIAHDMAAYSISWISSRGICVLLLDVTENYCNEGRSLGDISNVILNMESSGIRGLCSKSHPNAGLLRFDRGIENKAWQRLCTAYDLIIMLASAKDISRVADISPHLPLLLAATASVSANFKATGDFVKDIMNHDGWPVPAGFALSDSDNITAARLAALWHLPFWGDAKDDGHIAERILERSVFVEDVGIVQGQETYNSPSCETQILPNANGTSTPKTCASYDDSNTIEHVTSKLLELLRSDQRFKEFFLSRNSQPEKNQMRAQVSSAARQLIAEGVLSFPREIDRENIVSRVVADAVGFGPLEPFIADPETTEIMVNSANRIYVEKAGIIHKVECRFADTDHLMAVIDRLVAMAGRRIDESSPMVDARLPDGSRLNAVIPPISIDGPAVTIRKFWHRLKTADDAVTAGMLPRSAIDFILECVRAKVSIVVSGGTGAGKTTFLGIIAAAVNLGERIVTIEDAAELSLSSPHVVRLESRPAGIEGSGVVSIRDLVRNALRMRPDRIIVGECRGPEAFDMLQALNTGHEGSLTTIHANSPRDAISRLETMVLMAGTELPLIAIRDQIVRAVNLIVQLARRRDGVRRVVEIAEIVGMEGSTPCMQTLAAIGSDEKLAPTGLMPRLAERLRPRGLELPRL